MARGLSGAKKIFLVIVIYCLLGAGLLGIYLLDLVAASSIPREKIVGNMLDAYAKIDAEGLYPSAYDLNLGFYDNWTDAVYCNIIINQDHENPLVSGIANYMTGNGEGEDVIDALRYAITGEGRRSAYSNFWLGNIVFVKVLLMFFRWGEIRYLLYLAAVFFQVLLSVLLCKRVGLRAMSAYLAATAVLNLTYNVSCIQASSDILIMQMGCICILLLYSKMQAQILKGRYEFFFCIGSFQYFMGFVYAPMLPLGMFIVLMLLLDDKCGEKNVDKLKWAGLETLFWLLGYGTTALGKQGIAWLVLGEQIGMKKLAHWSSGTVSGRLLAFLTPLKAFDNRVLKSILLLLALTVLVLLLMRKIRISITAAVLKKSILLSGAGILFPYVYFAILSSAVGHGFYCQNIMPTVFAVLCALFNCFETVNRVSGKGD